MGVGYNSKIVTDGLVLALDAGNAPKSAKGFKNLLNLSTWTLGTGSVTGFSQNGLTSENQRILDTGPFGVSALVWDTPSNDATSDGDGGWETSTISIDVTKTYRFSTWIRRKTIGNGSTYLGPHSNWGAVAGQYILNRSNSAENQNPYFYAGGWWGNANDWYLVVGHVYAAGSGSGSMHTDSGIYNTSGTKLYNTQADFMWAATNTNTFHRSYLYYSTDTTTSQQWYQPRIDMCDGTEPTIAELIAGVGSKWYDLTGTNHSDILNSASIYNSAGYMNFDGVDDFVLSSSNATYGNNTTWEAWVYCTGNVSTYNMFMGRYLPYFSFYSGNSILFSNIISGTQRNVLTSANLSLNTWYHVICTTSYDGVNTTDKIYVNGVEAATGAFAGTQTNYSYKFMVGDGNNGSNTSWYPFQGRVANVKVYNRTLTVGEIQQNFNALRGRFGI